MSSAFFQLCFAGFLNQDYILVILIVAEGLFKSLITVGCFSGFKLIVAVYFFAFFHRIVGITYKSEQLTGRFNRVE